MDNINININSMVEYIEVLVSIALDKDLKEYVEILDNLKARVENSTTIDEINSLKKELKVIDEELNKETRKLSSREEALIERGYSKEDVIRLTSFTDEQLKEKKNLIIDRITKACKRVENPICIYLGGQPGCGKTTISRKIRNSDTNSGLVNVSLDNYRSYHPNYLEIEDCIKEHWEGREETNNDTMGNDIADFTHSFAGKMSDIIIDELSEKKDNKAYNIVLEWGMRTPEIPLERMEDMKNKGYTNVVDFIMVHKDVSKEACKIRADVMNNFSHIIRRVPDYFHEMCINTLPDSAEEIYNIGYEEKKIVDQFILSTRDNKIVWDQTHKEDIRDIYREFLENKELSNDYNNSSYAVKSYEEEKDGFQDEIELMLNSKSVNEEKEKLDFKI